MLLPAPPSIPLDIVKANVPTILADDGCITNAANSTASENVATKVEAWEIMYYFRAQRQPVLRCLDHSTPS